MGINDMSIEVVTQPSNTGAYLNYEAAVKRRAEEDQNTKTPVFTGPYSPGHGLAAIEKNKYKFNEDKIFRELKEYIDSTYGEHYSGTSGEKIQVLEFIMSHCDNIDFIRGNAIKYFARYGKKDGFNRKDLMKAMHYGMLMLHYHDLKNG